MRRLLPVTLLALVATVVAAGCGGSSDSSSSSDTTAAADTTGAIASADAGALAGKVGPGFDISMDKSAVSAGTYTLNVDDEASIHDFHFTGPGGVDVKTEVSETGTKTFTVALQPGTYTFVCDPHSTSMKGTLTVT